MIRAMAVFWRPRHALQALAERPSLGFGLAAVVVTGLVSLGLEIAAAAVSGDPRRGLWLSLLLPVLFVAYWGLAGYLVDAGAGLLGGRGRRRLYLAVSGAAFPPLVTYALLALAEAGLTRWTDSDELASALAWTSLPVLAWFLALNALAVMAVYRVPALNALAIAMLPGAAVTAALILVLLALAALRAGGAI